MTAPTHRQYSVTFAFITAMFICRYSISEINYFLALGILILTSKYGALFPDVDHNWQNVKDKTVPNFIINKIIHLTGGKHRSWQTHSLDIVCIVTILSYYGPIILFNYGKISAVNKEVLSIMLLGFSSGWLSHVFADMLNGVGVRIVCWSKKTVAFVPKKIGKFRFNTGHEWEKFCYKSTKIINMFLGISALVFPYINNGLILGYIENFLS